MKWRIKKFKFNPDKHYPVFLSAYLIVCFIAISTKLPTITDSFLEISIFVIFNLGLVKIIHIFSTTIKQLNKRGAYFWIAYSISNYLAAFFSILLIVSFCLMLFLFLDFSNMLLNIVFVFFLLLLMTLSDPFKPKDLKRMARLFIVFIIIFISLLLFANIKYFDFDKILSVYNNSSDLVQLLYTNVVFAFIFLVPYTCYIDELRNKENLTNISRYLDVTIYLILFFFIIFTSIFYEIYSDLPVALIKLFGYISIVASIIVIGVWTRSLLILYKFLGHNMFLPKIFVKDPGYAMLLNIVLVLLSLSLFEYLNIKFAVLGFFSVITLTLYVIINFFYVYKHNIMENVFQKNVNNFVSVTFVIITCLLLYYGLKSGIIISPILGLFLLLLFLLMITVDYHYNILSKNFYHNLTSFTRNLLDFFRYSRQFITEILDRLGLFYNKSILVHHFSSYRILGLIEHNLRMGSILYATDTSNRLVKGAKKRFMKGGNNVRIFKTAPAFFDPRVPPVNMIIALNPFPDHGIHNFLKSLNLSLKKNGNFVIVQSNLRFSRKKIKKNEATLNILKNYGFDSLIKTQNRFLWEHIIIRGIKITDSHTLKSWYEL